MSGTLLIVEDDDHIASPLIRTLEREGYDVTRVDAGLPAIDRVAEGGVDVVLLDLGLPDMDGLDVCRRIREAGFRGGVLILTARGGELDRVVGLDVGADDYLAKPFGLAELLARVRVLMRRHGGTPAAGAPTTQAPAAPIAPADQPSEAGAVRVDTAGRRAWVRGTELSLTSKEFDLLALLHAEPGTVVTRERLMDQVWDENWFGSTKTLDTTLGRLRQKLEALEAPVRIVNVRGVGFRLEPGGADA